MEDAGLAVAFPMLAFAWLVLRDRTHKLRRRI
jgi:hypothetical protein